MIASSTLHSSLFHFSHILYLLWNKLSLLLLTFSSFQLYLLLSGILLPLTFTFVILFHFLELDSNGVHIEEFVFVLGWGRSEVLIVCDSLAERRRNTVQDDVDALIVHHLGIDIVSIDIMQVFLDSTWVPEIPDVVESPVQLAKVAIAFPNGILDLFSSIEPIFVRFLPFQQICFCVSANIG